MSSGQHNSKSIKIEALHIRLFRKLGLVSINQSLILPIFVDFASIVDQIITLWLSEMMLFLRYQFVKAKECIAEGV